MGTFITLIKGTGSRPNYFSTDRGNPFVASYRVSYSSRGVNSIRVGEDRLRGLSQMRFSLAPLLRSARVGVQKRNN